jgi:hypothetical protein
VGDPAALSFPPDSGEEIASRRPPDSRVDWFNMAPYYGAIMKASAMKRTTIMLPDDLRRRALLRAKQRGVSLGELIRDSLDAALPTVINEAQRDPLFEDVIFDGPAPADISANHDKYLYDDEK